MNFKVPRGTQDILPSETWKWQQVEKIIDETCSKTLNEPPPPQKKKKKKQKKKKKKKKKQRIGLFIVKSVTVGYIIVVKHCCRSKYCTNGIRAAGYRLASCPAVSSCDIICRQEPVSVPVNAGSAAP